MASQDLQNPSNLYPQVLQSNPDSSSPFSSSSSSSPSAPPLYPSLDFKDLDENLFIHTQHHSAPSLYPSLDEDVVIDTHQSCYDPNLLTPFESSEEVVVKIPGSIIHLIDKQQSIELASGVLEIIRLRQGNSVVAVLARVGDAIQWPLAKDEAAVKLDTSHYFFTLRVPSDIKSDSESDNLLNYGLTVTGKGLEKVLQEFDLILEEYSAFSVKEVERSVAVAVENGGSTEAKAAAYWTTLAPNVEDYSGSVARMIASGSGQLIKGILWCGDVTVDRLKWGNEFLKKRTKSGSKSEVSPEALKRMKRAKRLTKMSEGVATGILSGVVKVSGFITGSIVNSKPGKKFFNLLPGEIILASLDGFNKVCDAVEVAGRNVLSTTSTVTTDFVSHKHGEDAAKVTNEGLGAAGHAVGTAWAVFKIRKALNPKSAIKPTTLVKAAASHSKSSKSKT
ncbi:protein EARLY-RESPONSIVE TO DEHYDRATION 7, chloroplastic-like [Cynara cardunculus var. scolymus]|uniref:Senescence/spartin-associated n=1 Tax=Cynara cardunculus var. scolymus TaxID=59895 RepID=A0A103XSF4_CYNCS|nr:protein EARLY-RESPONSIVE TO DEHYDRATION 7, chloroplastic-like [Cynara cardunculus var. scolymus]KVH96028.1 Senescence/spartin-associated [Cynara cardunculus var. scolymus]